MRDATGMADGRAAMRYVTLTFAGTYFFHGSLTVFSIPFSLAPGDLALALYIAGLVCPAIVALLLADTGERDAIIRSLSEVRGRAWPIAAGLLAQGAIVSLTFNLAGGLPESAKPSAGLALLVLGQLIVVLGEEPGWRGYLLPRLLRLAGVRGAILAMSVIWGLWHAPMFFVAGSLQEGVWPVLFATQMFAWSAIHTALYLWSRGSLVPNLVFHAMANIWLSVGFLSPEHGENLALASLIAGGVVIVFLPVFQSRVWR